MSIGRHTGDSLGPPGVLSSKLDIPGESSVRAAKGAVVQVFLDDHMRHRAEERGVGAG